MANIAFCAFITELLTVYITRHINAALQVFCLIIPPAINYNNYLRWCYLSAYLIFIYSLNLVWQQSCMCPILLLFLFLPP